nr:MULTISPECIES: metallophosphoesterase [unclassified Nocardia]
MVVALHRLLDTLTRVVNTLLEDGVPFAVAGGCAVYARGGPATDHDVDIFVKPADAERARTTLTNAGLRPVDRSTATPDVPVAQRPHLRIAAVGDVHLGADAAGSLAPALRELPARADVLLLAGDLTRHGTVDEARVVAAEFGDVGVPVVAVLGNHDHHSDAQDEIATLLDDHGITVLEGSAATVTVGGHTIGVAGTKGFGGGFAGKCASVFGERQMRE